MNMLAPLQDYCPHTDFSSLGNTHGYSARSEKPVCGQYSVRREDCRQTNRGSTLGVQSSRQFMNSPDQAPGVPDSARVLYFENSQRLGLEN